MRWRSWVISVAAIGAAVACGSDQSTGTNAGPPAAAALALHFDTLAGALQASAPGDIRLTWYQDIASIVGLGVRPSNLSANIGTSPAIFAAATEVDAFADSANGKKIADSTYRLAAWDPGLRPTQFIDLRVRFLPAGIGKPDTTATYLTFYTDTLGATVVDSTLKVGVQIVNNRGLCVVTAMQHLTVPPNPCTHAAVDWLVGGGAGVLYINPPAQVSGTHLTH